MIEKDDIKTEILENGIEKVPTKFEGKATKARSLQKDK